MMDELDNENFTPDGMSCDVLLSNKNNLHVVDFGDGPVLYQGQLHDKPLLKQILHKDIEELILKKKQLKIECNRLEKERDNLRSEIRTAIAVKNHG